MKQASNGARVVLSAMLVLAFQQVAYADDQDVIEFRQLIMKQLDSGSAALGMLAAGQIPPDTLALQAKALAYNAKAAGKAFEAKVRGGDSKPEVWSKWADFSKRMETFAKKSEEMAKVAETGNVAKVTELLVDALPCKQCHDVYRRTKK